MNSVPRLSRLFTPEHYDLSLTLQRQARRFEGVVTITGRSAATAADIRLHSKDLVIHSIVFDGKTADFQLVPAEDELRITHRNLAEGPHIVVVSFSGTITDDMNGIYPCYFEVDGVKKELLATQLESHDARKAFPCIDEPEAKATFDVTLQTEPGITVLGNMPVKYQRIEAGGLLTTRFETTPRMSTYLVAWVAGELHKKTAVTRRGVEVSVWATAAQAPEKLDFALDIARRSIDFFEQYFGVPYPLPKSDHVALPDFSAGAMENWGLVTYREIALLVDPALSTISMKQQAALTIAHELSHQWFGNLVTMQWWNDLWLNESFANTMEYVAIDALEPSWDIWLHQATTEVMGALRRDCLDGVQSIQMDVHHPDEISTLFDPSIVYAKGGRLLHMLQAFIGEPAMRQGLQAYFETHAYGNTTADDLWAALSKASGKDIASFMHAWITQPGYPVVSVEQNGPEVTLSQQQFFVGPHQPSERLWPIPLHGSPSQVPVLLDTPQLQFALPSSSASQSTPAASATTAIKTTKTTTTPTVPTAPPLHLNTDSTAHFITRYSPDLFSALVAHLDELSVIDRLSLLHEQTLLAKAELQSNASLIPLLQHYSRETNEAVWDSIALAISELKRFVEDDETAEAALKQLVRQLVAFNYKQLGWEAPIKTGAGANKAKGKHAVTAESENDQKLRATIISLALYAENPEAMAEAKRRFQTTPFQQLNSELRASIMAHAVRHEIAESIMDQLLEAYKTTNDSELREDIALALTSTRSEATVTRLTGLLKQTKLIRPQDFTHWYVWLLRSRYARDRLWQWTQAEWGWMQKTFASDSQYDMFPRYIAGALVSAEHLAQYEHFFEAKQDEPALRRTITMGITELRGKVTLLERDGPVVREALRGLAKQEQE